MDWMEFISEHPGRLFFPRIGRSIYSAAEHSDDSVTLLNWVRETDHRIVREI